MKWLKRIREKLFSKIADHYMEWLEDYEELQKLKQKYYE